MVIKEYNKLIRDKIPEIIKKDGQQCEVSILSEELYLDMLDKKLNEELLEYQESKNIEELVDILEVVYAIAIARNCSIIQLEKLKKEKAEKRGAFEKRYFLKNIKII